MAGKVLRMLAFCLILWAFPQCSWAQVENLLIQVDGMTWNVCAYNAKTAVSRLDFAPSIQEMRVDLWAGTMEFIPKPGKVVNAANLKKAIADAGYSVRVMVITVIGELIQQSGSDVLKLPETGQRFVLQDKFTKHPAVSRMVRVTGRFEAQERGPDVIFVGKGLE